MQYITDTDFLPRAEYLDNERFILLYHSMKPENSVLSITMPNTMVLAILVQDLGQLYLPTIRDAMAKLWVETLDSAIDKLESFDDEKVIVNIPFLFLKCRPGRIIYNYKTVRSIILENLKNGWKDVIPVDDFLEDIGGVEQFDENPFVWKEYNSFAKLFSNACDKLSRVYQDSEYLKEENITIAEILCKEALNRRIMSMAQCVMYFDQIEDLLVCASYNDPEIQKQNFDEETIQASKEFLLRQKNSKDYYRELFLNEQISSTIDFDGTDGGLLSDNKSITSKVNFLPLTRTEFAASVFYSLKMFLKNAESFSEQNEVDITSLVNDNIFLLDKTYSICSCFMEQMDGDKEKKKRSLYQTVRKVQTLQKDDYIIDLINRRMRRAEMLTFEEHITD